MIKSLRVMLMSNNVQNTKMLHYAGAARFASNWALTRDKEKYQNGGKFISDAELRKEFTRLRHWDEYAWLIEVLNNVTKQAIKDVCNAYKNFFKGLQKYASLIGNNLEIKDLAVCSDMKQYKNINRLETIKKLGKRKRIIQRSISHKYERNKKGESYCKTNHVTKKEKLLLKIDHQLAHIRKNYLYQTRCEIVN